MRRSVFRILRCAILLLILPLTLALFAFVLPPQYTDTYLGAFSDKLEALKAAQGPRIVIAGGSGAAFAVRSDLLEQEFPGYSVVNLGMYASLGSIVPLDAAKNGLRENDIVIFLPEMNDQTLSLYFGSEAMWQAADGHWGILRSINPEQRKALLGGFPYFAAQKAVLYFGGNKPQGDGIYARASFNHWGDIDSELRERNVMPGGFDPDQPVVFQELNLAEPFIDYLNRYADDCAERKISFFFAFSPTNSAAADISGAEAFTLRLRENLSCPILGSADESLLASGWFYDTNFHLNSAGAVLYTAKLATWLKEALGIETETSFPLPDMPGTESAAAVEGDDTDAACFLYTEADDGLWITGLSPEGKSRQRLTIPAKAQGTPVTGFDAAVFAGNTALETLTIQANIHHIPDASFDGCVRLQEVIMKDVQPSSCTVSAGLLQGTGAWILVNPEMVVAYKTDYFWAVHAARIRSLTDDNQPLNSQPVVIPVSADTIRFDGNGGTLTSDLAADTCEIPVSDTHLRTNALNALAFSRQGYTLVGWNTMPDGSGQEIGPGSRFATEPGMILYAHWLKETAEGAFDWEEIDGAAWMTGYHAEDDTCVLPAYLGGLPLHGIRSGAFCSVPVNTFVVPPTVAVIEPNAFSDCSVQVLYLYDTLETVSDSSFSGCDQLKELHIGAATSPVYSISYYATFADKYDRLLSLAGQKKLVLFSGSSTRYGYDSEALSRSYPAYQVTNMGVYAYTNALPQMELILCAMESGDVLLHAPEFDCLNFQTCENNKLDFHFWAMMEADYGCVPLLDMRAYICVFDSLQQYLTIRRGMSARSYEETPNGYDDDGNRMNMPTYNKYGDIITLRANNKVDIMLKYVRADYTPAPFTQERIDSLNSEYQRFLDQDIRVLFTYTPRNRSSITEASTPENRKALDRLLREKLCVPVISNIEDSLMSGEFFFVIDSHLSNEGVRLHTIQIISDLKPWL